MHKYYEVDLKGTYDLCTITIPVIERNKDNAIKKAVSICEGRHEFEDVGDSDLEVTNIRTPNPIPISTSFKQLFHDSLVAYNRIEPNRVEAFLDLEKPCSLVFHTLFSGINECRIREGLHGFFELLEYDIFKINELNDLGLLPVLAEKYIIKAARKYET